LAKGPYDKSLSLFTEAAMVSMEKEAEFSSKTRHGRHRLWRLAPAIQRAMSTRNSSCSFSSCPSTLQHKGAQRSSYAGVRANAHTNVPVPRVIAVDAGATPPPSFLPHCGMTDALVSPSGALRASPCARQAVQQHKYIWTTTTTKAVAAATRQQGPETSLSYENGLRRVK
jgi:hypothetical protein